MPKKLSSQACIYCIYCMHTSLKHGGEKEAEKDSNSKDPPQGQVALAEARPAEKVEVESEGQAIQDGAPKSEPLGVNKTPEPKPLQAPLVTPSPVCNVP